MTPPDGPFGPPEMTFAREEEMSEPQRATGPEERASMPVETDGLWRRHDVATGIAYVLGSAVAGCVAVLLGIVIARLLLGVDRRVGKELS